MIDLTMAYQFYQYQQQQMKHHVHSLNSSPGKQKYSFGKANRFDPYKPKTDVSYLPEPYHDRRSAIMGYGQRSLTIDKSKIMYPHAYEIPSSINQKGGNSFKAGRYDVGGPLERIKTSKNLPGPDYILPSTLQKKGATLKPRLQDLSDKYIKSIPGPGAYSIPSSINNGQRGPFDSKFSSVGGTKIPPKQLQTLDIRTPTYEKKTPGPGQYDVMKYGLSNPESISYKKQKVTKFGKQQRGSMINKQSAKVPGPGQYKLFSQFDD